MSVSFEPNFKRRFHRVNVPLFIQVGEDSYKATDWSVDGFRIDEFKGDQQPGAEFEATLLLPYSEFSVHLPVHARLVRRDNSTIGCTFVDLSPSQQAALHHLVEAALEGRLGDLGETLYALRAPVPAAEKKLVEDADTSKLQALQRRLIPRAVLMIGATSALILGLAGVIYYLASRVRVPDGVIVGETVKVAARVPGQLVRLRVVEGQKVKAGEVLAELENPDTRIAHAAAAAKLQSALAGYQAARGAHEEELSRTRLYAELTPFQIAQTEAAIRAIEARLRVAKSDLERSQSLVQDNINSRAEHDRMQGEHDALVAEREDRLNLLKILRLNSESVKEGLFFDGREVQGKLRETKERVAVGESAVAEAKQELAGAAARLDDLAVKAPVSGTVHAVLHAVGETVTAEHPVVSIDAGINHFAFGNLRADEAVRIKPGMPVKVFVPSLGLKLKGTIVQIGQEALHSLGGNTVDGVVSTTAIPVKVAVAGAPGDLPPGIRAVLYIKVNPWVRASTL